MKQYSSAYNKQNKQHLFSNSYLNEVTQKTQKVHIIARKYGRVQTEGSQPISYMSNKFYFSNNDKNHISITNNQFKPHNLNQRQTNPNIGQNNINSNSKPMTTIKSNLKLKKPASNNYFSINQNIQEHQKSHLKKQFRNSADKKSFKENSPHIQFESTAINRNGKINIRNSGGSCKGEILTKNSLKFLNKNYIKPSQQKIEKQKEKSFISNTRGSYNSNIRKTEGNQYNQAQSKAFRYTTTFQDNSRKQNHIIPPKQNTMTASKFYDKIIIKKQNPRKYFHNTQLTETVGLTNQSTLIDKAQVNGGKNLQKTSYLQFQNSKKKRYNHIKTQVNQETVQFQRKDNSLIQNIRNKSKIQVGSTLPKKEIDWKNQLKFQDKIGQGTFGKVYKAKLQNSSKLYAVKKVFIDKKFKSRQLQIVNSLSHTNVMKVHAVFTTTHHSDQYLNIVMDEYPFNLYQVINNKEQSITPLQQKVLIFQMLKGLSYIHSLKICHRDIKPHNMLVNNWFLALCDFGSAKKLIQGQTNLSYICSRCYRAPELIFGSTAYTTQIDMWSVGCIILQMLNKIPLFIGENSLDHLLEVIKVLGTPSKTEVLAMNNDYDLSQYQLPFIKRKALVKLFPKADSLLLDFVNKLLVYSPKQRLTAIDAMSHKYFDEIRNKNTLEQLSKNIDTSEWFKFTDAQLKLSQVKRR